MARVLEGDDENFVTNMNDLSVENQRRYEQVRFCGLDEYNMKQLDELVSSLLLEEQPGQ
jgi:hypothetical protein